MKTTLSKIRQHSPCADGWGKLLRHLGKPQADDEPLSILTILDSNGLDDALWCLRAVEGYAREIRLYSVWCARQVQHLMTDPRSLEALDVAERYARGEASDDELAAAARDAVWAATSAATNSARAAAWAAADAAAAARIVARATARAAADAAAASARVAAGAAAWAAPGAASAAARKAQAARLREVCAECEALGDER